MKKLILIIFLIPLILIAQPQQSQLKYNSTTTLLDSAGTWTGNIEEIRADYSWLIVTIRSDVGGTGKVQWTNSNSSPVVWKSTATFTYSADDTVNNKYWFPITMNYYRVSYTNDTTDQTAFTLTSTLIKGTNSSIDPITGSPKVTISQYSSLDITSSIYVHDIEVTSSNPFPVRDDSALVYLQPIRTISHASTLITGTVTIDSTETDSSYVINDEFSSNGHYKVYVSVTDTAEYSFTSDFAFPVTVYTTAEIPNVTEFTIDYAVLPKIYWRRKGNVGSPVITWNLWGR